jgi:CTP-dependent riboflavin kinase
MDDQWTIKGKVVSGVKKGAFFTQLEWVQEQCLAGLGFRPYPGTLNIQVEAAHAPLVEELQKEEGILLIPPDPQYCCGKTLQAEIEGVSGALIIPEEAVRVHGKQIIEVMAEVKLKDALGLKDGDQVTLVVKKPKL